MASSTPLPPCADESDLSSRIIHSRIRTKVWPFLNEARRYEVIEFLHLARIRPSMTAISKHTLNRKALKDHELGTYILLHAIWGAKICRSREWWRDYISKAPDLIEKLPTKRVPGLDLRWRTKLRRVPDESEPSCRTSQRVSQRNQHNRTRRGYKLNESSIAEQEWTPSKQSRSPTITTLPQNSQDIDGQGDEEDLGDEEDEECEGYEDDGDYEDDEDYPEDEEDEEVEEVVMVEIKRQGKEGEARDGAMDYEQSGSREDEEKDVTKISSDILLPTDTETVAKTSGDFIRAAFAVAGPVNNHRSESNAPKASVGRTFDLPSRASQDINDEDRIRGFVNNSKLYAMRHDLEEFEQISRAFLGSLSGTSFTTDVGPRATQTFEEVQALTIEFFRAEMKVRSQKLESDIDHESKRLKQILKEVMSCL